MALRPRRLLLATLLFLFLAAGTVGAAGYTDTANVPVGPLPDSFTVAEARVGDRGIYTWSHVRAGDGGQVEVLDEHEAFGLEWLPPQGMRDINGRLHDVNVLHEWGWQTDEEVGWEQYAEPVYSIDRATDEVVAYAYVSETANSANQQYGGAHVLQAQFLDGADFLPSCGAYLQHAGTRVPLDRPVHLFRACAGYSNIFTSDPNEPLSAKGTQQIGDRSTVLFSSRDGDHHVWLDKDISFPVRIAVRDGDAFHVLRLTSYHRGATPLQWGDAEAPGAAAPEWVLAPTQDGLPSEAGIQHPFPASQALDAARNDPAGRTFAETLANGHITHLSYHERESSTLLNRQWTLTATDDDGSARVRVLQETRYQLDRFPLVPRLPVPQLDETTVTVTAADVEDLAWPKPAHAPTSIPTVESLMRRWQSFAGADYQALQPNTWGLFMQCLDEACREPYVRYSAGHESSRSWSNVSAEPATLDHSSVLSESKHARRGHEATLLETTYQWQGSKQVPTRTAPAPSTGQLTVLHSAAWINPGSAVIVGGTVGALLASLAYLLWPSLKSGGLALFSRHTPGQALDHPKRQQLMLAVQGEPGIHARALARRLGYTRSTTLHHLAKLSQAGHVRLVQDGGYQRAYPAKFDPRREAEAAATQNATARQVLGLYRSEPRIGAREAAARLGVSPGTLSYHLAKLRQAGLVPVS